jgi:protease II
MKIIELEKYLDTRLVSINKKDDLIFEEKSEAFTVSIGISSDEKYYFISTSDHNTSEQYYFSVDEDKTYSKVNSKKGEGNIIFCKFLGWQIL